MNQTKIRNFKSAHPGVTFPDWDALSPSEAGTIREQLRACLDLPETSDGLAIVQKLTESASLYKKTNALDDNFTLSEVLASLEIHPEERVYVNWYRFDEIDQIVLNDLVKYFDDIWYPSSDDIEVFDSTLSWMISVRHDGAVGFIKRGSR